MTVTASIPLFEQQHFVLDNASWELYERLLADIGDRPLRVTFDNGLLEMMAPLQVHEVWKSRLGRLIERMTEELSIDMESLGSTTFKRKDLAKGLEPDECFYIRNSDVPRKKPKLNLKIDPPPDLAVEIDITRRSVPRHPVYAALGIPEIWRFDGRHLQVLKLHRRRYIETNSSLSFPFLPITKFEAYLLRLETENPPKVLREFCRWLHTLEIEE